MRREKYMIAKKIVAAAAVLAMLSTCAAGLPPGAATAAAAVSAPNFISMSDTAFPILPLLRAGFI